MSKRISRLALLSTVVALALAALLLAACGATPQASEPAESGASAEPPTIKIVSPAAGATVAAGTITVAIESTGHKFSMPSNTNVAGEGHVHFTLDDRPFEMSVEQEAEIKDVEPGTHKLVAELVQNNTEPLDPPVLEEIEFIAE